MPRIPLTVVTLVGAEYVAYERSDGSWEFPHGELQAGEAPATAARRIVAEWSGTKEPKLELMDFRVEGDALRLVFRAMLTSDPAGERESARFPRGGLPELAGSLPSRDIEEMQKTSLNYKLTRG